MFVRWLAAETCKICAHQSVHLGQGDHRVFSLVLTAAASADSVTAASMRGLAHLCVPWPGRSIIPMIHVRMDAIDCDVCQRHDGSFFNTRLRAQNVWEFDVDPAIIDEAAAIFENGTPFAHLARPGEALQRVPTAAGDFFVVRVLSWASDAAWVSVDDCTSYARFQSIFERLELPQRFSHILPDMRLFSAFFVVRSQCEMHNFHTDYEPGVGADALTLITPLADYAETDSFQLSYVSDPSGAENEAADASQHEEHEVLRYEYRKGRAIAFGDGFLHSTEPGAGRDGEQHAYLCFTFGTARKARWPLIAQTLEMQTRVLARHDGRLRLSKLGEQIAEHNARLPPGSPRRV